MLWSDHSEESARQNLRQCLTAIRRGCRGNGARLVVAEGDSLRLDANHLSVDVGEFEEAVRSREPAPLFRALTLYRGQLLEGLNLDEGPFEEWLIGERRRLNTLAIEGLGQLLQHQQRSGLRNEAMQTALRLLTIDPLQEEVHRSLIRLYHDSGNTAQALKQYAICEKTLRRELGVEPEGATKDLRRDILRSRRVSPLSKGESGTDLASDGPASPPSGPEILREVYMHVPGRPRLSIVVLPFVNLGGEKDLDDFVEAITVNLTTDLSHLPDFFVIACKTAFAYKGKAVDARQIGRELGVRYVMEGSIQSGPDSLRVNAQLIDAESGAHLWAERFDKPRTDHFNMQDEITARLTRAMDVGLVAIEAGRVKHERPSDLDAVDLAMRGWTVFFRVRQSALYVKPVAYLRMRSASTATTLMCS
jgi:TolB-like protein/DNA-binding SARP family transcriptional activator